MTQPEKISPLVEGTPFEQEEVLTKIMGGMLTTCVSTIPTAAIIEILASREESPNFTKYRNYVPLPLGPFNTKEKLTLTNNEQIVLHEVMELGKQMKQDQYQDEEGYSSGPTEPFISTPTGLLFIVVFFLVFAVVVIYALKTLQESEVSSEAKSD